MERAAAAQAQSAAALTAAPTEEAPPAGVAVKAAPIEVAKPAGSAGRLVGRESSAARAALRRRQAAAAWSSAEEREAAHQQAGLPQTAPVVAGPGDRAAE
jgi:hypothetical protein